MVRARRVEVGLVVAPVGEQPAAVLAPLLTLSDELGVERIMLVRSPRTQAETDAITQALSVSAEVIDVDQIELLADMLPAASRRCLLINGGQWPTVERCGRVMFTGQEPLYASSRDHTLLLLNRRMEPQWFGKVQDLDVSTLTILHGAVWEPGRKRLYAGTANDALEGVVELSGSAGFLYAAVDARTWDQTTYRMFALRRRWLQSMGLDSRRLLLRDLPDKLRRPAEEDGIPIERRGYRLEHWKAEIASGAIADRPERQVRQPRPVPATREREAALGWDGPPVLAVIGTNPGTTLRSVWSARPARLLLLYDDDHPVSTRLAELFCAEPNLGCPVEPLGMTALRTDTLPGLVTDKLGPDARMAGGAGDKRTKLLLSGIELEQAAGGGDPPPIDTWVQMHAPRNLGVGLEPLAPSRTDYRAAAAVLKDLAATTDRDSLNDLTRRRRRCFPHVRGSQLVTSTDSFALGDGFVCTDATGVWTCGFWFERVCAVALTKVMDEVLIDIRYREAGKERDQLDIVTRCRDVYSHWSCKTKARGEYTFCREARGQSERLLGTGSIAVLATARRPTNEPDLQQLDRIGYVVDSRLLDDIGRLRAFTRDARP